jgi:hypothetical protein
MSRRRVILPADARFMQDLRIYKQTEKFIRQNSSTQHEAVKRILDGKGFQNTERMSDLQMRAKALVGKAVVIINASDIDISSEDGQTRVLKGFEHLIQTTYPNLRMLRDVPFNEADVGKHLRMMSDGLLANDATSLTEPEQELLAFIQSNTRGGVRTTVKSLIERFERKNYGWYYAAILCNLALLCARGKVEVRQDSNALEGDALERSLRNTNAHASMVLAPQVQFSASQVRALKEFISDFFDKPASSNEARALALEAVDALKEMELELVELHAQKAQYPFLVVLDPVLATLKEVASKDLNWFLSDLSKAEEALLDTKEKVIEPVKRFMGSAQRTIYDQARQLVSEQEDNFSYIASADCDAIRELLADSSPWKGNRLQLLKPQIDQLQQTIAAKLVEEKEEALARLQELEQRLRATEEFGRLNDGQAADLIKPFDDAQKTLSGQKRIAMIRDQARRFEEEKFPQLLVQLDHLARPTPPPANGDKAQEPSAVPPIDVVVTSGQGAPSTHTPVAQHKLVQARSIKVGHAKPWLATEAELDDYIQKLRQAWLQEIQAGNRVQI